MASNDPRGSSNLLEVATDVFAVVSRDVPANPSLRRRVPPAKARHLAADICAVVCGMRPACMIDYAPKMDAGVARAVLETLRADPRSGRHRETRALGVLLVEDVVLIADVDRVMRVFRDVGATGGADVESTRPLQFESHGAFRRRFLDERRGDTGNCVVEK